MAQTLRINSSNDMIISDTVLDASGNAVTTGQTVVHNIQMLSTGLWWGGSAFDQVSEPGGLAAAQVGTTGIYEQTLSGAFDGSTLEYIVHHTLTGTVARDFYDTDNIETGANVTSISGSAIQAVKMREALKSTIQGKVNTVPTAISTLLVKELSNDTNADLNVTDLLKNRVLIFTSGALHGHSVGILISAASASDPITLTVTDMVNFSNIAIDDDFVIV